MTKIITRKRKKKEVPFFYYELRYYVRESTDDEFEYMVLSHASDEESVLQAAQNMEIDLVPKGVFVGDSLEYAQICAFPE